MRKGFFELAKWMGRKPTASPDSGIGLWILCLLMTVPAIMGVALAVRHRWQHPLSAEAQVEIRVQGWKTMQMRAIDDSLNLADLKESDRLWKRASPRVAARSPATTAAHENAKNSVLWLSARLSEQDLARAFYMKANFLYLGRIGGRYRVFVDGEEMTWGDSSGRAPAVAIPLSMKRLQSGGPLFVAVEISDADEFERLDALGGPRGEGLVTPPVAENLLRERQRETQALPMVFAVIFGLVGAVFFLGWITHRRRQEYAVFAAFAFHQALIQICAIDFVRAACLTLDSTFWRSWDVSLLIWEASLGMLIGLSIARARASLIHWIVGATVAGSILTFFARLNSDQALTWQHRFLIWIIPLAFARGAMACLIQWNLLLRQRNCAASSRRKSELLRFGIGMVVVGLLQACEGHWIVSDDLKASLFRLSHLITLLFCYGVGVIQDRLEKQRVEETDWSDAPQVRQAS